MYDNPDIGFGEDEFSEPVSAGVLLAPDKADEVVVDATSQLESRVDVISSPLDELNKVGRDSTDYSILKHMRTHRDRPRTKKNKERQDQVEVSGDKEDVEDDGEAESDNSNNDDDDDDDDAEDIPTCPHPPNPLALDMIPLKRNMKKRKKFQDGDKHHRTIKQGEHVDDDDNPPESAPKKPKVEPT